LNHNSRRKEHAEKRIQAEENDLSHQIKGDNLQL